MKTAQTPLTERLYAIVSHVGEVGASSEQFLFTKYGISKSTLYNLERSGYLKREQIDIRGKSEGMYTLKQRAKSILGKGNYLKGSPTRTEIPTLLYMEEVVETFRQKNSTAIYMTERQIKGQMARQAHTKDPQELIRLMHEEAPDGRIAYQKNPQERLQYINIEVDGAYHGKELAGKLTALERQEHKTLWICTKQSRIAHVRKYAEQLQTKNIDIIYIGDLPAWQK
jgi:hypothetical protein